MKTCVLIMTVILVCARAEAGSNGNVWDDGFSELNFVSAKPSHEERNRFASLEKESFSPSTIDA